jgi:tetratricopeptide (TPR) repeat protein
MADGLYRKGVAMQEAGDGKSATNYFNKAIDVNPNHVLSHLQLAVMDIDSTKLGEASERLYNIMSAMNPNADEKALIKGLLEYAYNKNYMYAISLEQQEKYPQAVAVMLELEAFCEKDRLNICDSMNVQNVLERCRTGVYAAQIDMARKALKSERNDVAEEFALAAYNYYSENKEDIHDDMKFAQLAKQISESYIAEALELRGDPLADEYMAHAQALAEYTDKDTRELLEAKISTLNPGKTPLELEYEAIEKENVEESYAERFDNYLADNEKVELGDVEAEIEKIENDYVNDNTKQGITSAIELTEEMEAALAETKEYLAIGSYDKALEALDQATEGGVPGATKADVNNMYLMAIREITAKRMSAAEFAVWQGEQEVADSLIAVTNELITTYDVALDTGIARIMKSYLLTLDKNFVVSVRTSWTPMYMV